MSTETWSTKTTIALLVTISYAILFSVIGIRKFRWNNK
jgi:hypothetical protein